MKSLMIERVVWLAFSALIMTLFIGLTACGPTHEQTDFYTLIAPRPEVQASGKISDSFTAYPIKAETLNSDSFSQANRAKVSIKRAALEKEFLLQGALISQVPVAAGSNIKSRVVAFRERSGRLFLMEATQGHSSSTDLPQNLILTEFPVINDNANEIVFDFNAGMSALFVHGDWYTTDYDGPGYPGDKLFQAVNVRTSYLESAELDSQNRLVIRQIAQLAYPQNSIEILSTIEAKFYITPYLPDPSFKPFRSSVYLDHVGYFQISPQLSTAGDTPIFASRFHPKKVVTFAISANTPPEFKEAVRDGILYWNKALGREIVRAIDAPPGVTAPDFNYNVFQWINHDGGNGAYADAQMDPRTGEILHAQIYFYSALAAYARADARRLLRIKNTSSSAHGAGHGHQGIHDHLGRDQISLRGFTKHALCDYAWNESMTASLEALLASGADDATVLRAAQDHVREVAAHEVGHTLGLRHNFAGSHATNYRLADREKHVQSYIANGQTPSGLIPTSSVMDYLMMEESYFAGDQIKREKTGFSYDEKAMRILYDEADLKTKNVPIFCTDSQTKTFADCERFDTGSSLVEYSAWRVQERLRNLDTHLMERYLWWTTWNGNEPRPPVEKIPMQNPSAAAADYLKARQTLFNQLTTSASLLKIHRLFPFVNDNNREAVRKAHFDYLSIELQRAGGIENIFPAMPENLAAETSRKFAKLLATNYSRGTGPYEKEFSFTPEEKVVMQSNVDSFVKNLELALVNVDLNILAGQPGVKLVDHPVNDALLGLITERARRYSMAVTPDVIIAYLEIPVENASEEAPSTRIESVKLPVFKYPFATRLQAASLFGYERSEAPEWGLAEKTKFKEDFNSLVDGAFKTPIRKSNPASMPRPVARWLIENMKIQDAR